ncbi:MAG: glycosyltransferase family 2 protein, partial [Thermoanaerobacteraceae bacterium]|nr:glycosyltransferase family 2 protein [Thermoanaerobacteraceae bacterium]
MRDKILLIIPALNEEKTIYNLINVIKRSVDADILVINDGSNDNTEIEAKKGGAVVINLPFNVGIGGAMQTGYKYAYINDYDIAIQIDGDGQHDPSYIYSLRVHSKITYLPVKNFYHR